MEKSTAQNDPSRQRLPRYAGEQPLKKRTPENDEAALYMAQLAIQAKERLRKKKNKPTEEDGDDDAVDEEEGAQQHDIDTDTAQQGPHPGAEAATSVQDYPDSQHDTLQSDEESIDSEIPWPDMPPAEGDEPELRLPLKSMYDGSGEWPKRTVKGSKQYTWSNIGFPRDDTLVVPDFEDDTHIDTDESSVIQLMTDISSIRSKTPQEIADGAVKRVDEDNRTIETFEVHGRTVCRVKFGDVNAFGDGSPYSVSQVSKSLEQKIDNEFGAQPNLEIERWVTAYLLLSKAGQIGGRTDSYWKTARSLAQEQFYLNPDLTDKVQEQIEAGELAKDPAFSKMLAKVKKGCPTKIYNPYHQARRNEFAADNGLLHKVQKADIVLVLDQSDNIILFQCTDVFRRLLTKGVQSRVVQSYETYSSRTPLPFPDMTRHGLHWISFLLERPDLDFRNPDNDPRVAKSGVFHIGGRCEVGDPNGRGMPALTKDNAGRRVPEQGDVHHQLVKLRYSAFGACTEIIKFFFEILDPDLLREYIRIADEVKKLDIVPFQTRRSGEPFLMRALLVNLMTYEHKDTGDWYHGYACLLPVGEYSGGDLVLRELGLQIEAPPGCMQMFRGRELRHSITKWTGRRFVCVNVTHEAVRRWALRSLGEEVIETPSSLAASIMADCIDKEPEDMVPENHRVFSMKELFPETYASEEELEDSEGGESEASLPSKTTLQAASRTQPKADSSSDASAEASDNNVPRPKRQKKA
ncbi:hypothetical protein Daus18300_009886 [Diaporthe australafricana]|uniref:Uncharacterized protein n=1 Tax=Diaporthe australafricana TaxID=127596 RepID=A0ABR3WCK6_9PEZI